jgi:hypothetical protein
MTLLRWLVASALGLGLPALALVFDSPTSTAQAQTPVAARVASATALPGNDGGEPDVARPTDATSNSESAPAPALAPTKTQNVILVTSDGLRWQEVFGGADGQLMNKKAGGVDDVKALEAEFWRETPEQRREALLPFVWGEIAKKGQLFGNADRGAEAKVTNGMNFSYPGYNEIVTGKPDPRIDSNDKIPNPNVNVFEWLNGKDAFRGRVVDFDSWDVFPFILNRDRSGLLVNAGHETVDGDDLSEGQRLVNRLIRETPAMWEGVRYDALTYHAGLEYLKQNKPRVIYFGLGETDEFAHEGRYDRYLHAANRVDSYLRELWETAQAMPEYRDRTTLIVTTDHGRGDAPDGWKHHGAKTEGSQRIWIGVLGPDTRPLGERQNVETVTQSQIAATLARLLGEDYNAFAPDAGQPIRSVLP